MDEEIRLIEQGVLNDIFEENINNPIGDDLNNAIGPVNNQLNTNDEDFQLNISIEFSMPKMLVHPLHQKQPQLKKKYA